jgi:alkylhydroperoxidase family enzyme
VRPRPSIGPRLHASAAALIRLLVKTTAYAIDSSQSRPRIAVPLARTLGLGWSVPLDLTCQSPHMPLSFLEVSMSRVPVVPQSDLPEFEQAFSLYEKHMEMVPNTALLVAHRPAILRALIELTYATTGTEGTVVDRPLKQAMFFLASKTRSCDHCQAHTGRNLALMNIPSEKIAAVWEFETSPLFDDRERAALRLARDSAFVPNEVTDEHFVELRKYFDDEQLVELVCTCAIAAWLNCFNDTMATTLESGPIEWAEQVIGPKGWTAGKHG